MLTTQEVAERLNVTDRTVRNLIESGKLLGYRFGKSYRIKEEDYQKFLNASIVTNDNENK